MYNRQILEKTMEKQDVTKIKTYYLGNLELLAENLDAFSKQFYWSSAPQSISEIREQIEEAQTAIGNSQIPDIDELLSSIERLLLFTTSHNVSYGASYSQAEKEVEGSPLAKMVPVVRERTPELQEAITIEKESAAFAEAFMTETKFQAMRKKVEKALNETNNFEQLLKAMHLSLHHNEVTKEQLFSICFNIDKSFLDKQQCMRMITRKAAFNVLKDAEDQFELTDQKQALSVAVDYVKNAPKAKAEVVASIISGQFLDDLTENPMSVLRMPIYKELQDRSLKTKKKKSASISQ